jgi:hypothetical protein
MTSPKRAYRQVRLRPPATPTNQQRVFIDARFIREPRQRLPAREPNGENVLAVLRAFRPAARRALSGFPRPKVRAVTVPLPPTVAARQDQEVRLSARMMRAG